MKLIFEKSIKGVKGFEISKPIDDSPYAFSAKYKRQSELNLPEVSELEVVRHFTNLSKMNYSVDTNFYPLGSCTMKYNPRFTEKIAVMPEFESVHPLLPQLKNGEKLTQGCLQVLFELEQLLCEITGMKHFSMQPLAGAHGELTGVMMMAAYHKKKGNKKKYIVVPDASHGTNPATAAIAGYEIISVATDENGVIDLKELEKVVTDEVAGLMLTCPNTHGIFNSDIDKITKIIHRVDGITYYDGANLNAILGRCRPGDIGFDVMHINVHKTFATPHGGGGPGAGPVGVSDKLVEFLPISRVIKNEDGTFKLNYEYPDSIGYVASFYGNFNVLLKAYAYILFLGKEGLIDASNMAVLNANYIKERLKDIFHLPYDRICMHEVVFSASNQLKNNVHAIDIAKYLIDQNIHPPTVYFPLTVKEAIMIEPTETENKQDIDCFIDCMRQADNLCKQDPESFKSFPNTTPVTRPDETKAAKEIKVNYFKN